MKKIIQILVSLSLLFVLLLTALEFNSYNLSYYESFQEKNRIDEEAGISLEELKVVNKDLVDYLKFGDKALLEKHYNEREVSHMVDVFKLFEAGRWLRRGLLLFVVLSLIYLLYQEGLETFSKLAKVIGISFAALGVFIGFLAKNFSESFIKFHHIFFDNDLWLLDPKTDMMIRMLPQDFFFGITMRTFIVFAFSVLILCILLLNIAKFIDKGGNYGTTGR